MTINIHKDSHLDHGIPKEVRDYALDQFADRTEFFVETIEYPERGVFFTGKSLSDWSSDPHHYEANLPPISCTLHLAVPESEVFYKKRGGRQYVSRMCKRPPRMTREVTVVAGPHPEEPGAGMVLFTMYGGPAAPQEPGDPNLHPANLEASQAFWSKAALCEIEGDAP